MFRSNKQQTTLSICDQKYTKRRFLYFLCFNLICLNSTQAFSFSSPINIQSDPVRLNINTFRLSTLGDIKRAKKWNTSTRICSTLLEQKDKEIGYSQDDLSITKTFPLSKSILKETEQRLNHAGKIQVDTFSSDNEHTVQNMLSSDEKANRRIFLASALLSAGLAIGGPAVEARQLQWETSPVNKRSGITVFDAEKSGYNIQFITYLSRFLLSFDAECQSWWYARAKDIPRMASSDEVDNIRLKQFAAFSASVEIGLQEYQQPEGPQRLMASLIERYCPTVAEINKTRASQNLQPLSQQAEDRQQIEIKEARRQIALLFGLMKKNQPVDDLTKLLASIDNGSITTVEIENGGSGYAPGYGSPYVTFSPPEAGDDFESATGIAVLKPNGKILRLDLVDGGAGYTKPPTVTVSPPLAAKNDMDPKATVAVGKAVIVRDGSNKGKIMRIDLVDSGYGYAPDEHVKVEISPPDLPSKQGGKHASAVAVLELEVREIKITNGGSGYAVEKPIEVYVDPPPFTARVDLNNKLMAKIIDPDRPYPTTKLQSKTSTDDSSSLSARISKASRVDDEERKCYGRACYDEAVVATAYAVAERDSYASFRMDENPLVGQENIAMSIPKNDTSSRKISGKGSGEDRPTLAFSAGSNSSSSQLLQLLPSGIGLEYDELSNMYILAEETGIEETKAYFKAPSSLKQIDPEFGPRGRSPIEREKVLDLNLFLRFIASGALCSSTVHLLLTPLDVVKTKIQTDPKKYPNVISAFKTVNEESDSVFSFFVGWAPTFVGYFVLGGISFSVVEFFRRYFTEQAGNSAASLEIPIVLASSTIAAILGSFVLAPFEAVRVRSVAQPGYAPNALAVMNRMIEEEGISTLFSAVPVFISKEIPFTMAKFLVFDLSTSWMYEHFPTAKEDIQLSLIVSLIGGTLGGISAAIVSNPGDATISEMKKAKSGEGPIKTAKKLVEEGGLQALMRGVDIRMVFYSLIVSLQFFVYDNVRFALNIGSDDLKLYLNVLGGALQESGGPV